jgi:hypothetical protein
VLIGRIGIAHVGAIDQYLATLGRVDAGAVGIAERTEGVNLAVISVFLNGSRLKVGL